MSRIYTFLFIIVLFLNTCIITTIHVGQNYFSYLHINDHTSTDQITFLDRSLVTQSELRCYLTRAYDIGITGDKYIDNLYNVFTNGDEFFRYVDTVSISNKRIDLLVILLHGLRGYHSIFTQYVEEYTIQYKNLNVIFFITDLHDISKYPIKNATEFLHQSLRYLKNVHNIPICIMGTSNGARLAMELINYDTFSINTPILAILIAGPLHGTVVADFIPTNIWSLIQDKDLQQELTWNNTISQQMLQSAQLYENVHWMFHAAGSDTHIIPYTSSLPHGFINATYNIYPTLGHCGISLYNYKDYVQQSINWMIKINNN
jgi:hypothetical protein